MLTMQEQLINLKSRLYSSSSINELEDIVSNIESRLDKSVSCFSGLVPPLSSLEEEYLEAFLNIFSIILKACKKHNVKEKVKIVAKQNPFEAGRIFGYNENKSFVEFKLTSDELEETLIIMINFKDWSFEYLENNDNV